MTAHGATSKTGSVQGPRRDDRRRGRSISLAAALLAIAVAVSVVLVFVYSAGNPDELPWFEAVSLTYFLIPVSAFVVVGLAILRRDATQLVGWILTILGVGGVINILAGVYALHELPGRDWLVWMAVVQGMSIWAFFALMLLVFPTGRLPTPRWRPFAAIVVGFAIAVTLVGALAPWEYTPEPSPHTVANPIGVPGEAWSSDQLDGLSFTGTLLVLVSVAALIARWRRSAGDERQQLKWLGQAGALLALLVVAAIVPDLFSIGWDDASPASFLIGDGIFMVGLASLPIAIGFAVTRYRLYDVDRIISRTLGYGIVTFVLAVAFGLMVVVPQAVLVGSSDASAQSVAVVAVATMAVAATFNPLRRRVQNTVDRRFRRTRYDGQLVVAQLQERLREPRDLDALVRDVAGVVEQTLAPARVGVWTPGGSA